MTPRLLLVDGDNLVHRNAWALQSWRNARHNDAVGGIFGSLDSMVRLVYRYPDHTPIILWDSRSRGRLKIHPGYKGSRPTDDFRAEIDRQIGVCRRLFRLFGFRSVYLPGFEADDLIAALAIRNKSTIVSSDKDFFQLLRFPGTVIDRANVRKTYDKWSFFREMDLTPDQFRIGQAITGDASDGIPGVTGFGEMKFEKGGNAKKFVRTLSADLVDESPNWEAILEIASRSASSATRSFVHEFSTVARNYLLIELLSGRFAPESARLAMREQVVNGYTGVRLGEAVGLLYEHGRGSLGDDRNLILTAISRRQNSIEGISF